MVISISSNSHKKLRAHQAAVEGIKFNPNGKTLAAASWDTRIILKNLEEAFKIDLLTYGFAWIKDDWAHRANVKDRDHNLCADLPYPLLGFAVITVEGKKV